MATQSNVEKAAITWRYLDGVAKKLPRGPEWDRADTARKNALRTLGAAVDALNAPPPEAPTLDGAPP